MVVLAYVLLIASLILELGLTYIQPRSSFAKYSLGLGAAFLAMFSTSVLFVDRVCGCSALLMVMTVLRVINISRVLQPRVHVEELRRRTTRTASVFTVLTLVLLAPYMWQDGSSDYETELIILAVLQVVVAAVLFISVFTSRRIYRYRKHSSSEGESLPTVSVCIPARNETQDLPSCIESVVASTYPKLEILVLDDCSHDKTPDIIKKYAHAGVRFIKGQEPGETWLAKNAAYDKLADEAKGDVLLFIGVDVRLQPHTIAEIVGQLGKRDMISVLPQRSAESEGSFFMQPLRYWWELGLLRFLSKRPPVLSSCWAIRSDFLRDSGGFEGYRKAVKPEAGFAILANRSKKYAFLIANNTVGITSVKGPRPQYETALRIRYPQLKRRPEAVFLLLVLELLFVLGPAVVLVVSLFLDRPAITLLSAVSVGLLLFANAEVYKLALRRTWLLGLFAVPFLIVADWVVVLKSMYGYEFGKIEWKQRNICLPLLQVEKELPRLDQDS